MLIGRQFWLLLLLLGAVLAQEGEDADVTDAGPSGGGGGDDGGDGDGDGDAIVNEGDGDMDEMDEDDVIMVSPPAGPIIGTVVGDMKNMMGDDDDMDDAATRCHTSDGNSFDGYLAFRGIPYAEPPLSERRFRVCTTCGANWSLSEIFS